MNMHNLLYFLKIAKNVRFLVVLYTKKVSRPLGLVIQMLETFSIKFFMGNRKLQFAITRLQFHVAGISGFSKAFIVLCHYVFRQFQVDHLFRSKT